MARLLGRIGPLALVLACAGPAAAHHSVAIFDRNRTVTVKGVVTSFEWTNPHAEIEVRVPTRYGETRYQVECASPAVLVRAGWTRDTVKRGDTVTLWVHPLRSGDPAGRLERISWPDGRTLLDRN